MSKIILLTSSSISFLNYRLELLKLLSEHDYHVIACAPNDKDAKRVKQVLSDLNIEFVTVNVNNTSLNPIHDLLYFIRLCILFIRLKPDYIFSFTIKPVIYSSIAASLLKIKNRYAMITGLGRIFSSNTSPTSLIRKVVTYLYKWSLKKNIKVFFQNKDDIDLFVDSNLVQSNQAVLVNGSGVNLDYYAKAKLPDKISFILIARLLKEKGVYEYIEAAKIIKSNHPNITFYLAGNTTHSPASVQAVELKSWINKDIIQYLGYLYDVRPAIRNAGIFVLPTYYREGVPHTILEAMSMGRPIITTNTPGCKDTVVPNKNGYIIPVKNKHALVEAMNKFIQEKHLIKKAGDASREIAENIFDVRRINKIILDTLSYP